MLDHRTIGAAVMASKRSVINLAIAEKIGNMTSSFRKSQAKKLQSQQTKHRMPPKGQPTSAVIDSVSSEKSRDKQLRKTNSGKQQTESSGRSSKKGEKQPDSTPRAPTDSPVDAHPSSSSGLKKKVESRPKSLPRTQPASVRSTISKNQSMLDAKSFAQSQPVMRPGNPKKVSSKTEIKHRQSSGKTKQ